jgi:hypothetical protein
MPVHAEWLRLDPFTGREICRMCWDRQHGSKRTQGVCQTPGCNCACKSAPAVRRKELAAKTAAREQRKAIQQAALEAEDYPLRASNPGQPEPWLKLPACKEES